MAKRNGNNKPKKNGNGRAQNGNRAKASAPKRFAPLQESVGFSRDARNSSTTLSGYDFVNTVTVKGKTELVDPSDRILLRQPISATSFAGTRISALSQLWERYRWRKAVIKYKPAVPNTVACQLLAYIDTDPLDDPSKVLNVNDIIRQAAAQQGSRQWNFNSVYDIPLVVRKDDQLYYTGVDKQNLRFTLQGVLYILQVTSFVDFNASAPDLGVECGALYLDWECMFSTPQINPGFVYPAPEQAGFKEVGEFDVPSTIEGLKPGREYMVQVSSSFSGGSYKIPSLPGGEPITEVSTYTILATGDSSKIPISTLTTNTEFVSEDTGTVPTDVNVNTTVAGNSGPYVKASGAGGIILDLEGTGADSFRARLFEVSQ